MTPGLDADVMNLTDVFTFPSGCHVAEVEIDPETGARDAGALYRGRRLRPADQSDADRGPGPGRVAQGIGQAMLEHTVYDAESGQLLSGSLMDYALPRADDLPPSTSR